MDNRNLFGFEKDLRDDRFPNGYNRQDYHEKGFSDQDIEFWGLNQPGAPDPHVAGFEIMDAMDGDYDGEIDF